jgi:hypothetical protein
VRLSEEQKAKVVELMPTAERAAMWASRDFDAMSVAYHALCVCVARHWGSPHLKWLVCRYVVQRVRRELHTRELSSADLCVAAPADEQLALEALPDETADAVRAVLRGGNAAAELGMSQRELGKQLARARSILELACVI